MYILSINALNRNWKGNKFQHHIVKLKWTHTGMYLKSYLMYNLNCFQSMLPNNILFTCVLSKPIFQTSSTNRSSWWLKTWTLQSLQTSTENIQSHLLFGEHRRTLSILMSFLRDKRGSFPQLAAFVLGSGFYVQNFPWLQLILQNTYTHPFFFIVSIVLLEHFK